MRVPCRDSDRSRPAAHAGAYRRSRQRGTVLGLVYVFAVTQLSHYVLDHRLASLVVLGLLGLAVPPLPALGLGLCAAVLVLAVAALDYRISRGK